MRSRRRIKTLTPRASAPGLYLWAILYAGIVAAGLTVLLWQNRSHAGANHWVHFGTPLDRALQGLGIAGLLALAVPPGLAAGLALLRRETGWSVALIAVTCALLAGLHGVSIVVLD